MDSTVDGQTKSLKVPDAGCAQVIEPEVADAVTWVLSQVIDGPVSSRTGKGLSLGRPAAGKTGTTNESMAAWFAGYTPDLAAAVWVGNPKGNKPQYWMRNIKIGDRSYRQVYGATIPGPIWKAAMLGALDGLPAKNFTSPSREALYGSGVRVPDVAGLMPEEAAARLASFDLLAKVGDSLVDSDQPAGTVAWTDPVAGERIYPGETVTLYLSRGPATPSTDPTPPPDDEQGSQTPPPTGPPDHGHPHPSPPGRPPVIPPIKP
jgi:membrane peptidoglycan carboxypeptidase